MPKAEVKLVETGNKIQDLRPEFWHTCGSLDSNECVIKIIFSEVPSSKWISEFNNLKQFAPTDNVWADFIKNIQLSGTEYTSPCFGINRFSKSHYDRLIEDIKQLIDLVNTKRKEI